MAKEGGKIQGGGVMVQDATPMPTSTSTRTKADNTSSAIILAPSTTNSEITCTSDNTSTSVAPSNSISERRCASGQISASFVPSNTARHASSKSGNTLVPSERRHVSSSTSTSVAPSKTTSEGRQTSVSISNSVSSPNTTSERRCASSQSSDNTSASVAPSNTASERRCASTSSAPSDSTSERERGTTGNTLTSATPSNTTATTTISSSPPDNVPASVASSNSNNFLVTLSKNSPTIANKGTCAKFINYNPRYINEPIRHLLPNETSGSVQDCMDWGAQGSSNRKEIPSGTNCERAPGGISSKQYSRCHSPPLQHRRHADNPKITTTIITTNSNNPITAPNLQSQFREKISYHHDYNCRLDPSEPPRGKLHGKFVLKEVGTTQGHQK